MNCSKCIHYKENPVDPHNIGGPKNGVCRRYPPTAVLVPTPTGHISTAGVHAPTMPDSICGEFTQKVELS